MSKAATDRIRGFRGKSGRRLDKGTVSRWFKGTIPMPKYLKKVIAYLLPVFFVA